jgi:hypothetical protein
VKPQVLNLPEYSGCTMYSQKSTKNSGYNLVKNESLNPSFSGDSIIDIQDTTTSETLSAIWFSPKHGYFVRYNDFDYANATNFSVKNAFDAGLKLQLLGELKPNDIVIYGNTASSFYCAIKLVTITDLPGSENDKYEFNIKKQ